MRTIREVRHISVFIDRPPDEVYAFAFNPENLPQWATGLGGSIETVNGEWVAAKEKIQRSASEIENPVARQREGLGIMNSHVNAIANRCEENFMTRLSG